MTALRQIKKRTKKHNSKRGAQAIIRRELHEVWSAWGDCLKVGEAGGVYGLGHLRRVFSEKQRWTIILFSFNDSDLDQYYKVEIQREPQHLDKDEVSDRYQDWLIAFREKQRQDHLVGMGWVLIPDDQADVLSQLDAFDERFRKWGAYDRQITNIAKSLKGDL